MKLEFPRPFAALWCVCGLMLAGCVAQEPVQRTDKEGRLDRSLSQAAESFEKRRDYAAAVSYYRNLHRRDPNDLGAVVGLSRGLRHLQQAREAQAIILRSLKLAPKDPDLRAEFGKVQLALGEALKAVDTLSRVDAELNDKRWDIKIALAIAYDRVGMYDQAERRYRQALTLSPENAIVMNNFALSLAQAGRLPEAVEMLERAAAQPEATPRMRQNLAMLYAMKGDLASAERYVRRDMPPEIADQNMAYYRQLRVGMATGQKTAPLSVDGGTAQDSTVAQQPNSTPPAEVIASENAPLKKPATPAASRTTAAATADGDKGAMAKTTEAAPEKTAMVAPEEKPAPAKRSESDQVAKTVGEDKGASQIERMPASEGGKPATMAKEPMTQAAAPATEISPSTEMKTPEAEAKTPEMEVAAAPDTEAAPTAEMKTPEAGEKAPEMEVASVAVKGYRLQLGSFRSMDGAETLRARLLKEHSDLLRDVELVVETVTVAERGDFFRVNSRPLPDREMVDETCLKLAIRDVPCLLVQTP